LDLLLFVYLDLLAFLLTSFLLDLLAFLLAAFLLDLLAFLLAAFLPCLRELLFDRTAFTTGCLAAFSTGWMEATTGNAALEAAFLLDVAFLLFIF
jgi:hypothetical protein